MSIHVKKIDKKGMTGIFSGDTVFFKTRGRRQFFLWVSDR